MEEALDRAADGGGLAGERHQSHHDRSSSAAVQPARQTEGVTPVECWICRGTANTEANPIIHGICRCAGSIGHVHRKCIYQWVSVNGAESCPSCNAPYQWAYKCRKEVPYPKTTRTRITFVFRHFFLPLLFKRVLPLLALCLFEFLVLPVVVGCAFYGDLSGKTWFWQQSYFRCAEIWLLGSIFLIFSQGTMDAWKAWRRFLVGYHSHRTPRIEPLPIDELDRVYYEATAAALHKKQQRANKGRQTGESMVAVVYSDVDPSARDAIRASAAAAAAAEEEEVFSSDTDVIDDSSSSMDSIDTSGGEDDDWEDTGSDVGPAEEGEDTGHNNGNRRWGAAAAGNAIREGDDAAGEEEDVADPDIGLGGCVAPLFGFLDDVLRRRGRRRRLLKLCTHRLVSALLAALLLRTAVGAALTAAGLYAVAVAIRLTHTRRRLRNPRRRLDEMVANTLHSASQVTAADKKIWFVTCLTQVFLFSFVMPALGGLAIHYAASPFLVSAPTSFAGLLSHLNIVWLVVYWCMGTGTALVLLTVEASVMVPLFAPGVDLFFIRAIDLSFDAEQMHYELLLAQIYDLDPLGAAFDFLVIAPIELLAVFVFVSFPLWTVFTAREFVFHDVHDGRTTVPLKLLSSPGSFHRVPLPSGTHFSDWVHVQATRELLNSTLAAEEYVVFQTANVTMPSGEDGVTNADKEPTTGEGADSLVTALEPTPWAYATNILATTALLGGDAGTFKTLADVATRIERRERNQGTVVGSLPLVLRLPGLNVVTSLLPSWDTAKALISVFPRTFLLLGRASGACDAALVLSAHGNHVMRTLADENGTLTTELAAHRTQRFEGTLWTSVEGRRPTLRESSLDELFAGHPSEYSHRSLCACVGVVLSNASSRIGFLRRLADRLLLVFLEHPYVFLFNADSASIACILATMVCFSRFPVQRLQLVVLKPVCHFLARHTVNLEWFLFDQERDDLLTEQLTTDRPNAEIDMPRLPPQHLILRRTRYFHPDELPPHLTLRLGIFAVIFLLVGSFLFWAVPILVLFLLLGLGQLTAPVAIGVPVSAVFAFWDFPSFLLCLGMGVAMIVGAFAFFIIELLSLLQHFHFQTLVDETWRYVSEAERVLVSCTE